MAPLGYAVMKSESNTRAPNAHRYVTSRAQHRMNSGCIDVAKISSHLKVECCCIVGPHCLPVLSVSPHYFHPLKCTEDVVRHKYKGVGKSAVLVKSSSCGCNRGEVASGGEKTTKTDSSTC